MTDPATGPDRLIAIVGPTAVGKTDLALRLGDSLPIEIIGADSRQVYRYLDIGTAKPSPEQRAQVRHHMVDVIDPSRVFSLGQYVRAARGAIRNANLRGNIPVLVGGTGQYVMAVLEGWNVPSVAPDHGLRRRLESKLRVHGLDSLVDELREIDLAAVTTIDQRNPRRVIRAIERAAAGHGTSGLPPRTPPSFTWMAIGLTADRQQLYDRVDRRLDWMVANGFVEEVESLLAAGFSLKLPALTGIGYSELVDHLMNGTDLDSAVQRAKYRTHRYIRQQANWFRVGDSRINWFDLPQLEDAVACVHRWLTMTQLT